MVTAHFLTTVDKTRLQLERIGFKHYLVSQFSANVVMATVSGDSSLSFLYPLLSKLASIALTLPVSTADFERGFSTMNRIKTNARKNPRHVNLPIICRPQCGNI